jgi:hypothetical protein
MICWQAFNVYDKEALYSKVNVQRDWPNTQGPYKMIVGGDDGPPLTKVGGSTIVGTFPKGELQLCCSLQFVYSSEWTAHWPLLCPWTVSSAYI